MERFPVIKGKTVLKDCGNPKEITVAPESVRKMALGVMQGTIDRLIARISIDGEEFVGFGGSFKAVPYDEGRDIVLSDTLFVPPGVFGLLSAEVAARGGGMDKPAQEPFQFAFEVSVTRESNPQGYSWALSPLLVEAKIDPLDTIVASALEQRKTKALPKK